MPVSQEEVAALLAQLVEIDSVNPWLVPGGAGEQPLAEHIAAWLAPLGVQVRLETVEPGRPNLTARLPGAGTGRSLCLNAHLDTVGYAVWADRALHPSRAGDRLTGLGSADDKGHCAAALLVLKDLVQSGFRPRGDVWVALTMDEEGASAGTMALARDLRADAVLVLEPFALDRVIVTHQGFGWIDLIVEGRAAHGSAPEDGIDAIAHMAEVVNRLSRIDRQMYAPKPHPLNGKTVFHTSTIAGGTDYATYPAVCRLGIEIGTQPGETLARRVSEIEAVFDDVRAVIPKFRGRVEVRLERNPFEAQGHEALWSVLAPAIQSELGRPAIPSGLNAWADAALFQEAGIPTLMFGALGGGIHAPDEWVSLSELASLERILDATVRGFCG